MLINCVISLERCYFDMALCVIALAHTNGVLFIEMPSTLMLNLNANSGQTTEQAAKESKWKWRKREIKFKPKILTPFQWHPWFLCAIIYPYITATFNFIRFEIVIFTLNFYRKRIVNNLLHALVYNRIFLGIIVKMSHNPFYHLNQKSMSRMDETVFMVDTSTSNDQSK